MLFFTCRSYIVCKNVATAAVIIFRISGKKNNYMAQKLNKPVWQP